jgi:phosphatidylserine/phosphatidylglycerophosphate/cardiolipin synthase-like enzyme
VLTIGACATVTIGPEDCPAGSQKLAGCPPIGAIQDPDIEKLYVERAWEFSEELTEDPILFARDADIPIMEARAKFIDSTDQGSLSALATRIWMIENAGHTVDVMYYIFRDDLAGHAILGALCDAVQRGVDVRIMVDSLGSSSLKKGNLRALTSCAVDAGFIRNADGEITVHKARAQAAIFNASSMPFTNPNRRSHDKLIVVDGRFPGKSYAITGGRNVSLDYYGILADGSPNPHSYRDADILVHGPADIDPDAIPLGFGVEIYYTVLFLFDQNKRLAMTRNPDTYREQREEFRDSLAALKALPNMSERYDKMDEYMSQGFYNADVRLAHELANVINKNVVTKAVENLAESSNSIIHILGRLGEGDYKKIRMVSPYLFAARYTDDEGNVVVDDAANMLDWLERHPDGSIEIVTNSVLTSDNFSTQAVIDMDLAPRLLMSGELREQWAKKLEDSELNPELVESDEWREMVNHPRLAIYETGKMDDVLFGGDYHHSKLHAKYVTADDVGFVGTSNFDYRSRLYNNEMGFFFRSEELAKDIAKNTDYLISLSYRWGSPEWLEMRQRMREMKGMKASTVRNQRGIYKTLKNTGLMWLF